MGWRRASEKGGEEEGGTAPDPAPALSHTHQALEGKKLTSSRDSEKASPSEKTAAALAGDLGGGGGGGGGAGLGGLTRIVHTQSASPPPPPVLKPGFPEPEAD